MVIDVIKIFLPSTLAFLSGIAITPLIAGYLYRNHMWKKKAGKIGLGGVATPVFDELHKDKEVGTPRMGGLVIGAGVFLTVLILFMADYLFGEPVFDKLNFLSRNQTWLPLMALFIGGFIGFLDDWMEVKGSGDYISGGLSLKKRLLLVSLLGLLAGFWFYYKLDVLGATLPLLGYIHFGILFPVLFALVALAVYSGGVIDGIDGLSGGVFAAIFSAYGVIAFYQEQIDLAAFCFTIVGGTLAFLWFNVPPARFYLSETGSMALTLALTVVAFMTDELGGGRGLSVLPVVALPLAATTGSVLIQLFYRKVFGRKFFRVAPLHHHFEALGWPGYKVAMRYWIVSGVSAIFGIVLALMR
ncbi:MAG: hypothetical protein AAB597_02845 [Patescibacteria group bacterium]